MGSLDNLKRGKKFGSGQPTNKGGRKPKLKFIDFMNESLDGSGEIKFKKGQFKLDKEGNCVVKIPTNEVLAYKLIINAIDDPRYMDMFLKVSGNYAPDKVAKTNTKGEDVEDKPNVVVVDASMLTDEQLDKILEANKGKE